jgi:membrane protein YdbS with pleckstrin-like domain
MAVADQLQVGEKILYRASSSLLPLTGPGALAAVAGIGALLLWRHSHGSAEPRKWVWLALAAAALAVVGLLVAGARYLVIQSREYVVTDRRVIRQVGILSKVSTDASLDKVNNLEMRQSLLGRLLGFGDVEVDTASEVGSTLFPQISQPAEFKRAVTSAADAYRQRGRMAAAPTAPIGIEQIRHLKQLFDEGLISRDEYELKRRQLLDLPTV